MKKRKRVVYPLLNGLKRYILDGVAVVAPLAITVLLLVWIFRTLDSVLQPAVSLALGEPVTGLGFLLLLEIVLLAGLIVNSRPGRNAVKGFDSLCGRLPIFSPIYSAVKPIIENVVGAGVNNRAFKRVVFVEWPAPGMKTIAFITNEQHTSHGELLYSVYIPTSPTPQSGFYLIVREQMVYPSEISVEEAMKMVISAGIISRGIVDVDEVVPSKPGPVEGQVNSG